jgi:integrase/recombinase XerD
MQSEILVHTNPNYLHGCHPIGLSDYFGDKSVPLIVKPAQIVSEPINPRRFLLKRILNNIFKSDLPSKKYFAQYMRHKYRRNCRPNTIRIAATSLNQFLLFFRETGKQQIEQIAREDIEAFVESQQDRGLKPRTVRSRLCAVYAFVHFLIDSKVLGYELLERKIQLKLPEQLPRAIEPQDVEQLLSVINHVRDRAMILLLLRTGMRIGELLSTKVHDVDLNNQRILIYEAEKTGLGRVVYYSGDAQEALLSWLKVRNSFKEMLFYAQGRESLGYEASRGMFHKYLQKAEIGDRGYTLHCLRHTFATDLLNARMPLECLRILLGHSSLDVTRIYARLTDKTREREYFAAMDRILRGESDADNQCDY